MARVSLILPSSPEDGLPTKEIADLVASLEQNGNLVEVLQVVDPRSLARPALPRGWRSIVAEHPGLSSSAFSGIREAKGEVLVVLDARKRYDSMGILRLIEPVARGDVDLAIGTRRGEEAADGSPSTLTSRMDSSMRRLIGSSEPFSGLVALTPALIQEADLAPVGTHFTLELLVRTDGRRRDVAVSRSGQTPRWELSFDDLRLFKRLADHRFGNFSRLVQFCLVGASGMVVDLSCYAFFQWVLGRIWLADVQAPVLGGSLSLAIAGALSIAIALTWNFMLNRRLTFSYARTGSLLRQYVTYALSNALGIALSFTLRLLLPTRFAYFHRHKLAAAAVGIVAATGISFSMSRWIVFSRRSVARDEERMESNTTLDEASCGSSVG